MSITKGNLQRYGSLAGAHFIRVSFSFLWVYGNLSAYTDSYFRFSCYPKCSDCDPQWLLSLYVAGMFPGFFMVKPLVKAFGLKWTGIIAMALTSISLLASAWSMQSSVAGTAAMYGILLGPGVAIAASVTVQVVSGWAPERAAVLLSTTSAMSTMLAVLQNQIITAIVNPKNLQPDVKIGPRTYFSQPEILDRVPGILIIYGAMTLGLQLIGCLLITNPSSHSPDSLNRPTMDARATALDKKNKEGNWFRMGKFNDFDDHKKHEAVKGYGTNSGNWKRKHSLDSSQTEKSELPHYNHCGNFNAEAEGKEEKTKLRADKDWSYTPKQVLRSPAFYAVFSLGIAMAYSTLLTSNFYKTFGLLYIHNDKYLTLVGMLVPVISACSRVLCGIFIDKHFLSLKDAAIFGLALNSVLCAFWYQSARVSDVLYMFNMLGLAMAQSVSYVVIPTSAVRLFGPTHLSTNYGLVTSFTIISSILSPVVNSYLLEVLGWQWVFITDSIISLLVLCLMLVTSFNTQK
ncbi:major facilitator superfamily and major facilitator superfamily domain, general substrate transporter-containing protein [Plakobranchus ocellatus]|uniref:Major facilitator superfamily and major facilitator superfamily domain, general substrate transporter-containing protein n=1 Tax=Plakobranchus ocellatus TaxID=259542 RepID=A0AAV3XU48_9GAST|nr:major facilitator superfamily and major facilitator superfamily domain, general substrate transporter-containing protein [Plakobranchus ocellatus]